MTRLRLEDSGEPQLLQGAADVGAADRAGDSTRSTILAAPLAWMLREGARTGFLSWEKTVLVAAFVLPAISRTLATAANLPLAPFVLAALFVVVLRRGQNPSPLAGEGAGEVDG